MSPPVAPAATICIIIPEPSLRSLARYGFDEAAVRVGLPLRPIENELIEGAIVYGPVPPSWRGGVLPYDRRCYDATARFAALGSPPLWAPEGTDINNVDPVGGLTRLLTLTDETQGDEQAPNGHRLFPMAAPPAPPPSGHAAPLGEHHVAPRRRLLRPLYAGLPP